MNYTVSVPVSHNGIDFKNIEICWNLFIVLRDLYNTSDQIQITQLVTQAKLLGYNPLDQWGAIKPIYYKFSDHKKLWLW